MFLFSGVISCVPNLWLSRYVVFLIFLLTSIFLLHCCRVMEQPQAIGRALGFGGRLFLDKATLGGLDANYDTLKEIDSLTVVGCGSSFNAANYGAKLLRHMGVLTNVAAIDANSTEECDFRLNPEKSGLLVLSQSGETKDDIDVVHLAQRRNVPVISIVNGVGSTIANMTKCGVYTNAGQENAAPSTKSFTTQVVCMALVAMWFRQTKAKEKGLNLSNEQNILAESLQRLPITFGMLMRTQSDCKKAAKKLLGKEHCFVLGKGKAPIFCCFVYLEDGHIYHSDCPFRFPSLHFSI